MNWRAWVVLLALLLSALACNLSESDLNSYGLDCNTETRHGCD